MMGIVSKQPMPTYPQGFPDDVIKSLEDQFGTKVIGNVVASGTEIINRLRKEVLLCEDIKTRIPKMKEKLNELKKEEQAQKEEQELKKNKRKEKRL